MENAPLPPPAAAAQLGVSEGTLRRWARIYAEVFEELPGSERGGRLYTGEVLERLATAKLMLDQKLSPSYRSALERLRDDDQVTSQSDIKVLNRTLALVELASEVQALKDEVAELRASQVDLKLRLALPVGKRPGIIRRAWWFLAGKSEEPK